MQDDAAYLPAVNFMIEMFTGYICSDKYLEFPTLKLPPPR